MRALLHVDLYSTVAHASEHVVGERDPFILDRDSRAFPMTQSIYMAT
jgi:hypothetical protein